MLLGSFREDNQGSSLQSYTPWKFNSSSLKIYTIPKGKDRLPTIIFQVPAVNFWEGNNSSSTQRMMVWRTSCQHMLWMCSVQDGALYTIVTNMDVSFFPKKTLPLSMWPYNFLGFFPWFYYFTPKYMYKWSEWTSEILNTYKLVVSGATLSPVWCPQLGRPSQPTVTREDVPMRQATRTSHTWRIHRLWNVPKRRPEEMPQFMVPSGKLT